MSNRSRSKGGALVCAPLVHVPTESPALKLTPGEVPVLVRLLEGASNKEIAQELDCSVRNVEFHVSNLLKKSGQSSRTRLLAVHHYLLPELRHLPPPSPGR